MILKVERSRPLGQHWSHDSNTSRALYIESTYLDEYEDGIIKSTVTLNAPYMETHTRQI